MAYNGKMDEDRPNKLKFFNILWDSGFICRLEVSLKDYSLAGFPESSTFSSSESQELTDIDVFAWKYIPFLGTEKLTSSIKGTAKNTKDKAEIFKLAGINSIIKPIKSFYVKDNPDLDKLFLFAHSLKIGILSQESLNDMESRIKKNKSKNNYKQILTSKGANIIGNALEKIKTNFFDLYNFSIGDIWSISYPIKYYLADSCLFNSIKNFNPKEKQSLVWLLYSLSNYLVIIADLVSKIELCRSNDINIFLMKTMESEAKGGELAKNVYEVLTEAVNNCKNLEEAKLLGKQPYDITKILPYFSSYSVIIKEFWKYNFAVFTAIRIIDYILYQHVEYDRIVDAEKINTEFPEPYMEDALYLIRYVIQKFEVGNNKKNMEEFGKLFNFIRKLD